MSPETLIALNLYGVRIMASSMLPPEFFVVDDWADPSHNHHPEWLSIWAIGKNTLIAHPSVLNKLADEWNQIKQQETIPHD